MNWGMNFKVLILSLNYVLLSEVQCLAQAQIQNQTLFRAQINCRQILNPNGRIEIKSTNFKRELAALSVDGQMMPATSTSYV